MAKLIVIYKSSSSHRDQFIYRTHLFHFRRDVRLIVADLCGRCIQMNLHSVTHILEMIGMKTLQHFRIAICRQRHRSSHDWQKLWNILQINRRNKQTNKKETALIDIWFFKNNNCHNRPCDS